VTHAPGFRRAEELSSGMAAQLKRAAMRLLGVPVGRAGARRRHPEQPRPRATRAVFPGVAPRDEDSAILHEVAIPPEDADVTAQGCRGHTGYDRRHMTIDPRHPISPNQQSTWEGDESVFAADLATEIWHRLTR